MASASTMAQRAAKSKLIVTNPGNIHLVDFDGSKFEIVKKQAAPGAPSWVTLVEPDVLYAVDENSDTTYSYSVDLASNKIEKRASAKGSAGVVHLAVTRDKTRMVGAAYGNATIDIFDVTKGTLKFVKTISSKGKSPADAPHPHQAVLDPSGRFFAVNDLGTDTILLLDSQADFAVVNNVPVEPAGCGPRHGSFFPLGTPQPTHYMVVCEKKNVVVTWTLKYGGAKGIEFQKAQVVSTFKSEGEAPAKAAAGELVVSPDSKQVYVSNRLTGDVDSIALLHVTGSGTNVKLQFGGLTPTLGKLPRMFSISRDGKVLFVANQGGSTALVALKRNADGSLDPKPVATMDMKEFPGDTTGPQFVQQVV
jgi:6-phosphogluconolactonase (cycloisomerase 2 family)